MSSAPTFRLVSVEEYLAGESSSPVKHVLHRDRDGFDREVYSGLDAIIPLPELGIELPLAEIYEGAHFAPEEDESEGSSS